MLRTDDFILLSVFSFFEKVSNKNLLGIVV